MSVISLRVNDDERAFIESCAELEGKSLSAAIKDVVLEWYEDKYDAAVGDAAYEEWVQDGKQTMSVAEMKAKYEL
ncbi:MAG: DUF1778 domain-containing protein [Lactobacillales bacterium]|jgi:hypothetical protein|nr:DUF1778 domain-containing protein [Lactobacillales bacterium]